MSAQQFSLRWNNYTNYITGAFDSLRYEEDLVDVTLCCEGRKIRAHKILLSACSAYFKEIFKENPCQHPVIIFKNVKYTDLMSIVEFMYQGEVSVVQESLPSFLHTAELLSIRGLTDNSGDTRQPQTQQPTSSLAQQIIQTQNQSLLDKATITTAESVYLTLPSNSTIVHQPAKLLQAQIQTAPQILNKTIIKAASAEMPALTATGATITVPISQPQQHTIAAKIQVQPQQTATVQQQVQVHQPQIQQQQHVQTHHQQSQPQQQQTQATTLQEVVESVVSQPKKKKIKVQQIITSTPNQSGGPTTTVVTTQVPQGAAGGSGDTEIYETSTETYHITTAKAESVEHRVQEQEQVETYVEAAQASGATLKMEIPEYIDCSEAINASSANNTSYIQEESYELVGENMEDKDEDDEDMNQDGIEMEASDMDMSRIFQGATDDQTKATLLQDIVSTNKWSQCQICKLVITSVNLWRHMRTQHTNQEPKKCDHCSKQFKNKYSLREHVRMAHENKLQQQQQPPHQQQQSMTTAVSGEALSPRTSSLTLGSVLEENNSPGISVDASSAAGLTVLSAAQLAAATTMKLF
ncbi:longitudinals lacking protein, isoforms H/M/V-like isoform X1 [Topomyia yanbarensis]|uniref:longitudinals lacking protein, isoforms H/M/V-like isoform X1 n=1 Tax=Topomyia yanbarensis TaxID=2498891 RepID=UPI00273CB98E|nr:longitudinals lacking protein, isoforms H/M/V-like isoform X1 [Topomyia yanbarensis]XP_058823591.1 longitudinals lacking protein, isoforms H/M/V-like isoform X1 [Topomyia yanbarensis]